jgi:hypothetical protein
MGSMNFISSVVFFVSLFLHGLKKRALLWLIRAYT